MYITLILLISLLSLSYSLKTPGKLVQNVQNQNFLPLNAFSNPFSNIFKTKTILKPEVPKYPTVIIPKDFSVAGGFLGLSGLSLYFNNIGTTTVFGLIGLLLLIQTTRVRFVFDNEALQVYTANKENNSTKETFKSSGENFAVGGENRWKYNTFTKWFFIPSKELPILMYFKETQTKSEGQIHFFPVIMNSKVLYETMMERIGPK